MKGKSWSKKYMIDCVKKHKKKKKSP